MGVAFAMSPCIGCRRVFIYNPMKVPSMMVHGEREPICEDCIGIINARLRAAGQPEYVPLPGAYDPCDESELGE